jgi:hypothetical protein
MSGMKRGAVEEAGLGMLEFAIILPVLVVIVAGLVDYGNLIRELNTLSLIARDAARTAAAHARAARNTSPGEQEVYCVHPTVPLTAVACNADQDALRIREYEAANPDQTPDSVQMAAKKAACLGLQRAQLPAGDFQVTPTISDESEVAGNAGTFTAKVIRVEVLRTAGETCLLCWGRMLSQTPLRGDGVFVLEDRCR